MVTSSAGTKAPAEMQAAGWQRPYGAIRHEPVTGRLDKARVPTRPAAAERLEASYCKSVAFLADHTFPLAHLARATRIAAANGTTGAEL